LTLLRDRTRQHTDLPAVSMDPQSLSVIRYDGEYEDKPLEQESVMFCSSPYLILREKKKHEPDTMKSLLHFLYGYDVGDIRENKQVISQRSSLASREILNVANLWCMRLGNGRCIPGVLPLNIFVSNSGSGVIVTCGEIPLKAIFRESITVQDTHPHITIRIVDDIGDDYYLVIKRTFTFVVSVVLNLDSIMLLDGSLINDWWQDLIARVTIRTGMTEFDLFVNKIVPVTSEKWLQLLDATSAGSNTLEMILKQRVPIPDTVLDENGEEMESRTGAYEDEMHNIIQQRRSNKSLASLRRRQSGDSKGSLFSPEPRDSDVWALVARGQSDRVVEEDRRSDERQPYPYSYGLGVIRRER